MDKGFEEAVGVVMEHLAVSGYSYSRTRIHVRCYQQLEEYMANENKQYDTQVWKKWFEIETPNLSKSMFYACRLALNKLDAAFHGNEICDSDSHTTRQKTKCLPAWCRTLLDNFTGSTLGGFERTSREKVRVSVAVFLGYMSQNSVTCAGEITHWQIAEYCRSISNKEQRKIEFEHLSIRKFLRYLSDRGIIKASVAMTLDPPVLSRFVLVESLPPEEQGVFSCSANGKSIGADAFFNISIELDAAIKRHNYSQTMIWAFHKTWITLYVFLEANSLEYTFGTAVAWAHLMRRYTQQWGTCRRAVMLFEQYLANGDIDPQITYKYKPDRAESLPAWCRGDFDAFIDDKKKEGIAYTTYEMYRNSCLRLLEYLNDSGISGWDEVTPVTLKAFHLQDPHLTPEGKNAYMCKIRFFLEHLGENGRVPTALFMALPGEAGYRTNIITTLDDSRISELYRFRDRAEDAHKLRNAAIILIGLRMGLRASDIVKIRFPDVSWEDKTISVQQQKTDRFLKIPMPTEVGNAIYRYILESRPNTASEYIFITHRVPYTKLSHCVCWQALNKALPEPSGGFHITRRTYASRLLINNVAAGRIAETLGHADNSSVMQYLSTDGEKMRMCSLPISAVPLKGGALLA